MKQAMHLEQQYQTAKYSNTACSSSQETPCCLSLCPADGSIIKIKAAITATEEVHQGHSLPCAGWLACVFTAAGTEGDVVPQIPEYSYSQSVT